MAENKYLDKDGLDLYTTNMKNYSDDADKKRVSIEPNQGLTELEKTNARVNIDACGVVTKTYAEWQAMTEEERKATQFITIPDYPNTVTAAEVEQTVAVLQVKVDNLIKTKTFSESYTISENGIGGSDIVVSESGYTPIGVVGVYSDENIVPEMFYVLDNTKVRLRYLNISGSEKTFTGGCTVLYKKD